MIATYPNEPGHKVDGTSAEAATAVREDAQVLRAACLELLERHNLTADEAAERLHRSILSIRPRFSELVMRRLIRDSGERRKNASGKMATVWTTRPLFDPAATVQPYLL